MLMNQMQKHMGSQPTPPMMLLAGGSGLKIDKNITATSGQKITLQAPQIVFLSGGGGGGANVALSNGKLKPCEQPTTSAGAEGTLSKKDET